MPDSTPVDTEYLRAGGQLYDVHCASCHKENGKGIAGTFPPLAGNGNLADLALVVTTIRSGHSGTIEVDGKTFDQIMPAVGSGFTAREIAEVATYIRNSWGNQLGGVDIESVKRLLDISAAGDPSRSAKTPVDGALLKQGHSLFLLHCATCHQESGKGIPGTFPPLADDPALSDGALIVKTVRNGHSGEITVNGKTFNQTMPAIGSGFSAEELAAVATYVRNSWGNDFGGVSVAEVKSLLGRSASGR